MKLNTITRGGKEFVLVPVDQYDQMVSLPPLPPIDKDGTCDAIEFARATIARKIIRMRQDANLTQQQLAKLAGVRQETISRLESGKHTATIQVLEKIEKALKQT